MELLATEKQGSSESLLVVFNSYANRAFDSPHDSFSTRLEGYGDLVKWDPTVIWFAEKSDSWFTNFENDIILFLVEKICKQQVQSVVLIGMSCGGFAALRCSIRLSHGSKFAHEVSVVGIAINPQTGFREELLDRIRAESWDWTKGELGKNPVILVQPFQPERCGTFELDVRDLAQSHNSVNGRFEVYYDTNNPIERVFCEDLFDLPRFNFHPEPLGMAHADGCQFIWNSLMRSGTVEKALKLQSNSSKLSLIEHFHALPPTQFHKRNSITLTGFDAITENLTIFTRFGTGALVSIQNDETKISRAEFQFQSWSTTFELWIEYASNESRPVDLCMNDLILSNLADDITGGWTEEFQVWKKVATINIAESKLTSLYLKRNGKFPHIRRIVLVDIVCSEPNERT